MSDSDADDDGGPPLEPIHRAAIAGDLAAMRRELEAGVSPDCVGEDEEGGRVTPLLILCSRYPPCYGGPDDIRLEAVRILLAAGASPDGIEGLPYESALCNAAFMGNPAIVELLLAAGADASWTDIDGWTPLHAAASRGCGRGASCAVALLEAGAAVDAGYNSRLITPLSIDDSDTWTHSRSRVIPVLLRYGADLDRALRVPSLNIPFQTPRKVYLERVQAAGGWKRYERAHRIRLTTTFARVVFPRVPTEVVSHIVSLWAHVGYY